MAFASHILTNPREWQKYGWDESWAIYQYLSAPHLGGGGLAANLTVGDRQIPTPLYAEFDRVIQELQYQYGYEDGADSAGGFFIIPNVAHSPDVPDLRYDLLVLAHGPEMNAQRMDVLKQHNLTGALSDAPAVCCYTDYVDSAGTTVTGLSDALWGMGRVLQYWVDPASGAPERVVMLYEGQGAAGEPAGFGRLMRDGYQASPPFSDNVIGYLSGADEAAGKYVYFRDMEFLYSGAKAGPYAEGPPDEEYEFNTFLIDSTVDEAAEYRRSLAYGAAEAFGEVATRNIMEFPKYNWLQDPTASDGKGAVYKYMSNPALGGGPLDLHFQVGTQEIASPLYDIWGAATADLMDRYEQGDMTAGGFFILLNM